MTYSATFRVYPLRRTDVIKKGDFYTLESDQPNKIMYNVGVSIGHYVRDYPEKNYWRIVGTCGKLTQD
jgi:hypothetical protein